MLKEFFEIRPNIDILENKYYNLKNETENPYYFPKPIYINSNFLYVEAIK